MTTDQAITVTLAEQIRAEHEQVGAPLRRSVEHAIRAGELLIEAKSHLGHGEWLPWLDANCGFAERTAQAYMRLARNRTQLNPQRVADLSVREALALLTEPKPAVRPMPVKFKGHCMPRMRPWEFENLKQGIAQHGVLENVIFNRDGEIIDGYERALACWELGIDEFPCASSLAETDEEQIELHWRYNMIRRHDPRGSWTRIANNERIPTGLRRDAAMAVRKLSADE